MKLFKVKMGYEGLAGKYIVEMFVAAKDEASARKKAEKTIGNRDGQVVSIQFIDYVIK